MDEQPRKMSKKEFWIRFGIWVSLAAIAPFTYLAIAYGLFSNNGGEGKSLSGWGVFAVVFVSIVLIYIINQTKNSLPNGSFMKQCIGGFMALIPLIAAILIIHSVRNVLADFERFLIIVFVCEAVAVPVNPLPKWAAENNIKLAETTLFNAFSRALGKNSANNGNGGN